MRQFYTPEGIGKLKRRARTAAIAAGVIAGVGLAFCVALCFGIRTKNADIRQIAVIAISTLSAWAAATLTARVRLPLLREAAHEEGVLRESAQPVEGTIVEIGSAHPIPKSITFQPVALRTETGEISLKLNAAFSKSFPGQGQFLRAETHRGYLTAWDASDADASPKSIPLQPRLSKPLPRLSHGLACVIFSALIWSWIFTFLTDTDPANKIVLYADMQSFHSKALAVALEKEAPAGIRFVQVHPFSYALMDSSALERADLYVMTEKQLEEYAGWIEPGTSWLLYNAETGEGAAKQYLDYSDQAGENWYLYPGAQSLHTGAQDSTALEIAEKLLCLP